MVKSALASSNHTQNSKFRFSGTWAGACNYDDNNWETKIRIDENNAELTIIDLTSEGESETYLLNVVESRGASDKEWYDSFTSRLTRVNENTFKLEASGVYGNQLPSSDTEKGLASGVFTIISTVNNNQLTINTSGKIVSPEHKDETMNIKCNLKRVG